MEGNGRPLHVHRKKKKSPPYYRPVFAFGIKNRALQYLVRDVLIALLDFIHTNMRPVAKIHAAIKHTKQALIEGNVGLPNSI